MKIVLATCGSRGDVQPMLALALALQSAGHEVLLAGPPEKAAWAAELGCPYHRLGSDLTAFVAGMQEVHSPWAWLRFVRFVRGEVRLQFAQLPRIIAGADVVVGASLALALSSVAESLGIAYRYMTFTPQLLESGRHPHPVCALHGLGAYFNRLTWLLGKGADQLNFTPLINQGRHRLGLGRVWDAWPHVLTDTPLVASDAALAPVPDDTRVTAVQTGYLYPDLAPCHDPGLEAFLASGPAPVFAGFGSMPGLDQARNAALVAGAMQAAGQRLVMARNWPGETAVSASKDLFFIGNYPHQHLFPRMAAIIHHGGAGTTATSARSGVPQIIVAHALDQFYWGHHVHRCGIGPKPLRRARLTAHRLAAAIRQTVSNPDMQQAAGAVAEAIKTRDGLGLAVAEIEAGASVDQG